MLKFITIARIFLPCLLAIQPQVLAASGSDGECGSTSGHFRAGRELYELHKKIVYGYDEKIARESSFPAKLKIDAEGTHVARLQIEEVLPGTEYSDEARSPRYPENLPREKARAVGVLVQEMALEGYEYMGYRTGEATTPTLLFRRNEYILTEKERSQIQEPADLGLQQALLTKRFGGNEKIYPSTKEGQATRAPIGKVLSAKTLQGLEVGYHAFVQTENEPFLRVYPYGGAAHEGAGHERARLAGNFRVDIDPVTGLKDIVDFDRASGTYLPQLTSLSLVLQPLWQQGVFPRQYRMHPTIDGGLRTGISLYSYPPRR